MTDSQRAVESGEELSRPAFLRSPFGALFVSDVRLQFRYGLYTVYAILTVLYSLGLQLRAPGLRTDAAVLVIVSNPTALGFYFIAALMLFEKEEGVLDALVVSPLGDRGYLLSKALTLSLLATLSATLIAVAGNGVTPRTVLVIGGVALSAPLFVFIGVVGVARFKSINEYFMSSIVWASVLFVPPLVGYLGLFRSPLVYLFPTQPVLLVVEAGLRPIAHWQLLYSLGYLVVGNVVTYAWARRAFRKHIVRGEDARKWPRIVEVFSKRVRGHRREFRSQSPWTAMVRADLRKLVRDPMFGLTVLTPLVLAVFVRVGVPFVESNVTQIATLSSQYPVIAGTVVVVAPGIYGFVVGIFVLEDQEQGILTAYRTSPFSARNYLAYRSLSAYLLSFAVTLPALVITGLVSVSPVVVVATAAVSALTTPFFVFALSVTASNTIEGIALTKFANILFLGPSIVIALVPEPLQFAVGVFPTYWAVKTFVVGVSGGSGWILYFVGGLLVHAIAISSLGAWFVKRKF